QDGRMNTRRIAPWGIAVAIAASYPIATFAGGASPRFPGRCTHPARSDGDLEVVFGRFTSTAEASALLEKVLAVGFKGSQVEPIDACGVLKVTVRGIPTLKVGREVLAEARSVGISATLENVA